MTFNHDEITIGRDLSLGDRDLANIKKLKTGRWQAQIFLLGVRKAASFDSKTEAKDWAAGQEYKIKTEANPNFTKKYSVSELFLRYEREVSRTKRGYMWEQGQISRLLKKPLAKLDINDVTKQHIRNWRDDRLATGIKTSTLNREWNLLSHIFSTARDEYELIKVSPVEGVKRPPDPPARDRLISEDEIEELCVASGFAGENVHTVAQKVILAFLLAIETAMRMGEICDLTWDNIDFGAQTAFLPTTKNGTSRTVALSKRAIELLKLVPNTNAQTCFGITSKQCGDNFGRIRNKTTITDLHFHDTRHEAITRLSKKMPILALARNVGHTDIKQLMTYYNESASEIAKLLD